MITRIGNAFLETVSKEPEVGDTWHDNTVVAVYEVEPLVYELVLDNGHSVFVMLE